MNTIKKVFFRLVERFNFIYICTRDKVLCKDWLPYHRYDRCDSLLHTKCTRGGNMFSKCRIWAHLILPLLLQSPFPHLSSHHVQALSGLLDQQTSKSKNQPQLDQPQLSRPYMSIEQNQPMLMGRYKSQTGSTRIAHLVSPWIEQETVFKPKRSDVCTDFAKVSLEIRPRVISRSLIIFLCWSEVSDLTWSGPTFVPASLISRQKAMLTNKHILSFTLDWQLKRNQVLWRVYQMGKSQWKGERFFYIAWILIHLLYFFVVCILALSVWH